MFSTPRRKHVGWAILYVCATAFILGVVVTVVSTRQIAYEVQRTQLEGTPTGKKLVASADRILDCTDPGDSTTGRPPGECYARNLARSAEVVGDLNDYQLRIVVLAAACSADVKADLTVDQREAAISNCITQRLAHQAAKP